MSLNIMAFLGEKTISYLEGQISNGVDTWKEEIKKACLVKKILTEEAVGKLCESSEIDRNDLIYYVIEILDAELITQPILNRYRELGYNTVSFSEELSAQFLKKSGFEEKQELAIRQALIIYLHSVLEILVMQPDHQIEQTRENEHIKKELAELKLLFHKVIHIYEERYQECLNRLHEKEHRRENNRKIAIDRMANHCDSQIGQSQNSVVLLVPISSTLFPDAYIESSDESIIASDNKTATMRAIEKWHSGDPQTLLMVGEGGIGKTATMLSTCRTLLKEQKLALYIPLRFLKNNDESGRLLQNYINEEIFENDEGGLEFIKPMFSKNEELPEECILFLDGYNEVKIKNRHSIEVEIRELLVNNHNLRIIISSRRTLEEDDCMSIRVKRITLKRLSKSKVEKFLRQNDIEAVPENVNSELLGIPLLLKIYVFIMKNQQESIYKLNWLNWHKQMDTAYDLLWNYIQCQIYNAYIRRDKFEDIQLTEYDFVLSGEFLITFIASQMNTVGYVVTRAELVKFIRTGLQLIQGEQKSRIMDRISDMELDLGPGKWSVNKVNPNQIYYCLVNALNLLKYNSDEQTVSFIHQDLQDILHYQYLENALQEPQNLFYKDAWTANKLPYDVLNIMSRNMSQSELDRLWMEIGKNTPGNKYGVHNVLEVYKRKNSNDLTKVNFEGTDIKQFCLINTIVSKKNQQVSFRKCSVSQNTFTKEGHLGSVTCVDYASNNGKFLSTSYDKTVRIWSSKKVQNLRILSGHNHYVRCAQWSPNEAYIASGSDDRRLLIWDPYSEQITPKQVLEGHNNWILCIGWSQDSKSIASGDEDGNLFIWRQKEGNTEEFERADDICKKLNSPVTCLKWNPVKKNILVCGTKDGKLHLYNLKSNRHIYKNYSYALNRVEWSPDGRYLLIAYGRQLKIYDYCDCYHLQDNDFSFTAEDDISGIVYADTFIGYSTKKVFALFHFENVWKDYALTANPFREEREVIYNNINTINSITWSRHDNQIVTGSEDSTICFWKPRNTTWLREWYEADLVGGQNNAVRCVAWSDNGREIIAGYDDHFLRKWDISKRRISLVFQGHGKQVKCVAWKNHVIASGANDGLVCIWDSSTGELLRKSHSKKSAINVVTFDENQNIVFGTDDGEIYFWDYTNNIEILMLGHKNSIYSLIFYKDYLISSSKDCTIRYWDYHTKQPVDNMIITKDSPNGHQMPIRAIQISPIEEQPLMISASNDKTLRRWNADNLESWDIKPIMDRHTDYVYCLDWNIQGQYIASGSTDFSIIIWDAQNGELIQSLLEHKNYILSLKWSKDGKYLASASLDGKLILWEITNNGKLQITKVDELEAFASINIVNCDFTDAEVEPLELKEKIRMNGGIFCE